MARFCVHCGRQLDAKDKVCGFCGTPIDSGQAVKTPSKKLKKKSKKKFLLGVPGVVFAAIIAVYVSSNYFGYNSVLKRYCKAVESADMADMLSVYPPEYIETITSLNGAEEADVILTQETQQLHDTMEEQCGKKFDVSYEIVGIKESENGYFITLQFQGKGKEGSYYGKMQLINVYKSGDKWYLELDSAYRLLN